VVKLGFDAVDQVRRRVQQETLGHRGRAGDPLYGIRRVLRRGHDHHSDLSWTRLLRGLDLGDPRGEVAAAWIAARSCACSTATPTPPAPPPAFYRRRVLPVAAVLRRLLSPARRPRSGLQQGAHQR
jgi:hypothetical protein